ncbi:hypothetical protein F5148DRAFT_201736 [Russula earlei]|uniref:Uncharacterized protein n=1 Tax=Russula earlei TaxID=71964 RepID=A0ACC0UJT3_9AGAM|nr:hypothetical protein F5148DRAFT_201736 [Russula earlei]
MFKRVDRRRKRKETEERLDLDEDERVVFGLHDTDSSESESSSSESASAPSSSAISSNGHHGTRPRSKRKRGTSPPSYDESGESESGDSATDAEDEEEEGSGDGGTKINLSLTLGSALQEPIRLIRPHPEAWVCAFCPGKILKHTTMVKVHEASRIHQHRFKRIQELAMEFSPDDDLQCALANKSATEARPKADDATLSRRGKERKEKQAKLKERRKRLKARKALAMAKAEAKKAITTTGVVVGPPSQGDEGIKESHRTSLQPTKASRRKKAKL